MTSSDLQVTYPILFAITVLLLKLKSLGFNYNFNGLTSDPETNELMKMLSTIFKAGQRVTVIPKLKAMYPVLRFLVRIDIVTSPFLSSNLHWIAQPAPHEAEMEKAADAMSRIGIGLLEQTKDKSSHRKDLLSVLANTRQMNEEDVMSRAYTVTHFQVGVVYLLSYTLRVL